MVDALQLVKEKIVRTFRWGLSAVRCNGKQAKATDSIIDWDFMERVKKESGGDECGIVPMEVHAHWERHGVVPSKYARYFEKNACAACGKPF
ncbi:hypothetical protein AAVH_13458 [Aphelenchoides avenae]|nr:hypothetical protein AAVH_13458 [Aphelenchus avenae]